MSCAYRGKPSMPGEKKSGELFGLYRSRGDARLWVNLRKRYGEDSPKPFLSGEKNRHNDFSLLET